MNRIESMTYTFAVPQCTDFPFRPRPKVSFSSPHSHNTHILDRETDLEEPCWETMDAHICRLDNLRALQFKLPHVHPDFRGVEKAWMERIVWHLRLLRDRENFALSFAMGGEVILGVLAMPRPLPVKLHLRVLEYAVLYDWETEDKTRMLLVCCLVCRAWYDFCKTKFYDIHLRSRAQLNKLRTHLSSSTHSIGNDVKKLTLSGDDHIYHFAPIHLARKLTSLRYLAIKGTSGRHSTRTRAPLLHSLTGEVERVMPFFPHDCLLMALRQFKTVTELSLSHVAFQSFWHFRRFLVALPALSRLHLGKIYLPQPDPFNQRVPPPYHRLQNLMSITLHTRWTIHRSWNPLWIWVLPVHTLPPPPTTRSPNTRPSLIPRDVEIISALIEPELNWYIEGDFANWSYSADHQQCKSKSGAKLLAGGLITLVLLRRSRFRPVIVPRTREVPG